MVAGKRTSERQCWWQRDGETTKKQRRNVIEYEGGKE